MIPRKLHFTYRTKVPPQKFQRNIDTWKRLSPDWKIHYYSNEDIFAFFDTHFPHYISDLTNISLGVLLADLFRYAALFIEGGMYADIDTTLLKKIPENWHRYSTVLGYEYQKSKAPGEFWYKKDVVCQWAMLATPGHPLFKEALDQSILRLRDKKFRLQNIREVIETTGPFLFTSVAEKYLSLEDTLLLDMEFFGANPNTVPKTADSIIEHQFHGNYGWKLGLSCPLIDIR